ncbi:peptide chain release factor 2 [Bacillus spizizenii]|nr:peptide chain release factor 2 [Bacillus subtilis]OUL04255.1 peptide chain release factor 2 [Bacillus spizizenii]
MTAAPVGARGSFNEVNRMELSEIRAELENMASRLADFRGSL